MSSNYCMRVVATKVRSFSSTPRVPSIKFIGKRSQAGAHAHNNSSSSHTIASSSNNNNNSSSSSSSSSGLSKPAVKAVEKKAGNGVDMISLKDGAWYGRPKPTKVGK